MINTISPKIECLGVKIPTKFGFSLLNFSREKFLKTARIKFKEEIGKPSEDTHMI